VPIPISAWLPMMQGMSSAPANEKICSRRQVWTMLLGCAEGQHHGGLAGNGAKFLARHFRK